MTISKYTDNAVKRLLTAGAMLSTLWVIASTLTTSACAQESSRHALLIAGLGGTPEYTSQYHTWLYDTRKALVDRFMFAPEDIMVLADSPSAEESFIDDISSAENINAAFARLASGVTTRDDVYIILFGHGSYDGRNAMLNIPRQDIKDADYALLVDTIEANSIVFINTASCSGPFINHLSAPNRIVITATRSATERNATIFPEFFVEALKSEDSDRDKSGDLSILEIFHYASERTARWYSDSNHLATEHPIMDDNGDRRGYMAMELAQNGEGDYAGATYLIDRTQAMATMIAGSDDNELAGLFEEQLLINQSIARLKSDKSKYPETEYYSMLEPLFVRLARITGEIENRTNR